MLPFTSASAWPGVAQGCGRSLTVRRQRPLPGRPSFSPASCGDWLGQRLSATPSFPPRQEVRPEGPLRCLPAPRCDSTLEPPVYKALKEKLFPVSKQIHVAFRSSVSTRLYGARQAGPGQRGTGCGALAPAWPGSPRSWVQTSERNQVRPLLTRALSRGWALEPGLKFAATWRLVPQFPPLWTGAGDNKSSSERS